MSKQRENIFEAILKATNKVRETNFSSDNVDMASYLGGELGIDSREMLEIWYEVEEQVGVKVHDYDKRGAYTIKDVVDIVEKQLAVTADDG